jgi:Domain of unknown function (DUF4157)
MLTYAVPSDIASTFRSVHGVDVADVPVHRGRTVAAHAQALGARAFASGQEVYLPDAAGSLDHPQARALLAHELTHAAQERRLGGTLPDESSAAGQLLEAQAVATERWFLGGQGRSLPVISLAAAPGSAGPGRATLSPRREPRRAVPPLQHVQRQALGEPSGAATAGLGALSAAAIADLTASGATGLKLPASASRTWSAPAWLGARAATSEAAVPGDAAAGNAGFRDELLGDNVPAISQTGNTGPENTGLSAAADAARSDDRRELKELREQLTAVTDQRPVGLDDPIALDELATRLYQRLRSRLRLELIVDRERAGLLSDFR